MNSVISLYLIVQGFVLLGYLQKATCNKFFFNATSSMQVTSGVIPLNRSFDFRFRTCKGGVLLSQQGPNSDFFLLEVVPTVVNYSVTPLPLFIPSHLKMTWEVNRIREFVTLGIDLDRNDFNHLVRFNPGDDVVNSTLSVGGLMVDVSNRILGFANSGPLFAGLDFSGSGAEGFVGCIESGKNILLDVGGGVLPVGIINSCPLDSPSGCPQKVCPFGFTGYYCQNDINECKQFPCDVYSTCVNLIGNYSCTCGPRWTGRHCKTFLGSLCNIIVCNNSGVCTDTPDKNNYTCTCKPGFTGRNCEHEFDPCESSPCENGGSCSNLTRDDFQCTCPPGFRGKSCNINIDECASLPCNQRGQCIDGINNYTCNCTGSGYTGLSCSEDVNECQTNKPCHPNATCINHLGTYQCDCHLGFTGMNCYENIDDCRSSPCQNGGSCFDEIAGYSCNCSVGFDGVNCENNIDDCNPNPCNNYSSCQDGINSYSCICNPGFTGLNCTTDINECDSSPCQNEGNCTNGVNYYNCSCPARYTGPNCEVDLIDDCINHNCLNNATCVDGVNHFNCTCLPGYEGLRCENEIDECRSSPCLNSGTCFDKLNNFTCNCTIGFVGHTCEINVDDCAINPCQNNATCVDGVNERTCRCTDEFYGDDCDKVRDACHPNPCGDNGNCSFVGNLYNCTCDLGFEGENCSINIEDCKNDSCVENATCIDGINEFTCQCPAGFYGNFCHLEINECASNPCRNNGTCIEEINGYECSCVAGFNGTHCENDIDDCVSSGCKNGTCHDGINNFTCSCNPGFTGRLCNHDVDECSANPCKCGTCENTVGSFYCICNQWSTGKRCQYDIDECSNKSLCSVDISQGFCQNADASTIPCEQDGYKCFCSIGFQGYNCELNTDDCASSPCKHGGTCNDLVFAYNCDCASGWTGKNCDVDINECDLAFCTNNATCNNSEGTYTCTCAPGFSGTNCSIDIDECKSNPCVNGNCTDLINDFKCTCFPGFEGKNCSKEIDECSFNPCVNNGTCKDLLADFNCTCPSGFDGKRCERSLCEPYNPCLNNGTCKLTSQNSNFTCECAAGFAGSRCQNITSLGFSDTSLMKVQLNRSTFDLSFQFRTIYSNRLLAADSNNSFLVLLDNENVTVIHRSGTKLSVGQTANLSNGLWHSLSIKVGAVEMSIAVDNSSCGKYCEASASLHANVSLSDLYFGGSPFATSVDQVRSNFTGCIQDVVIDDWEVIPTEETRVVLVNTTIGCLRQEVCAPNPCAHGKCVDQWTKYICECGRRWIGPQCNTTLIPVTFGATEPLNVATSIRRRRDVSITQNASFAKFLTNDTSFGGDSGGMSFFIRTRELSGLVVFMTDGSSNHIAVVIHKGTLVVQVKLNGVGNFNVTIDGSQNVTDGEWHFVEVLSDQLRFDNTSQITNITKGRSIKLTATYLGGLDDNVVVTDAFLIKTSFRGCLQDVRLNNRLFDFNFNNPSSFAAIAAERYQLIDSGHLHEDCKGMNICRSAPCGDGGFCRDLWNKYHCDCKPRYGGVDCALYGCSLVNLCPANTTCADVEENYECVHPVTLNGSSSYAEFTFSSNVNVTLNATLRLRTRTQTATLIEIYEAADSFFQMELLDDRVQVHFNLSGETGTVYSAVSVSDGTWHNVVFNITQHRSYLVVDGDATFNSSGLANTDVTSLLQRTPVKVGQPVYKGCLDDIRIGGLLLPFVDYYNGSFNVSHVIPLQPRFVVNATGVQLGCHSDDVCSLNPCVRGECGDVWDLFTCACPEGWAGNVCNLTANLTCAQSPCVNGTCSNLTRVDFATNQSQVSDVGYDMFNCTCFPGFEGKQCEIDTKECESNPCKNGASCTELHLNYSCSCIKGFTGRNCGNNIDECANNNCTNNSTCVDGIDSYNCSCRNGFHGRFCELDIDECASMPLYGPCNVTGTVSCNNNIGGFKCICKQGYFGSFCENDPSLTCEILQPCVNGSCSDNATGFTCSCFEGYNGTRCENDIHECQDHPCMNNATCLDSHSTSPFFFPGYNCTCTVDYSGKQCETKIDPCKEEPCKNNATCERLAYNEYRCNCTPEYKGDDCTIFDPCYSEPCLNGATCNPNYGYNVSNYTCACAFGFYGRSCENVTDYCSPEPCQNNATCENFNTQGRYFCNCTEGFGNVNCSGLLANCDPNPCVQGTCVPLMNGYQCECSASYEGVNCSDLIDKCDSDPCQNGGSCEPFSDHFECRCAEGWRGSQCQFKDPCLDSPCKNSGTCKPVEPHGNVSCACPEDFSGDRCETSLEPTSGDKQSESSPLLIGLAALAGLIAVLFFVLLIVVLKKRGGIGTYSPSKEEGQAGRLELDSILKPPPLERLI